MNSTLPTGCGTRTNALFGVRTWRHGLNRVASSRRLEREYQPAVVAIDGSKFKAVNSRDRDFTPGTIDGRIRQIEESISRYLDALETADRTHASDAEAKAERLQEKIERLHKRMRELEELKADLSSSVRLGRSPRSAGLLAARARDRLEDTAGSEPLRLLQVAPKRDQTGPAPRKPRHPKNSTKSRSGGFNFVAAARDRQKIVVEQSPSVQLS